MTVVLPIEPDGESRKDPLEVIGLQDVTVPIEHPARARTEVHVTFSLWRPPSAREMLLADQRNWRWGMSEGVARLRVDGFRIGDISHSLDLVKERLAEISRLARQLDLTDAETRRTVMEKLRAELPEVCIPPTDGDKTLERAVNNRPRLRGCRSQWTRGGARNAASTSVRRGQSCRRVRFEPRP